MRSSVIIVLLLTLPFSNELLAQAGISINPKRVVLEDNQQTKELFLLNRTDEAQNYRISFREYRMNEDGSLSTVEKDELEEDHFVASDHVRFFPRRLTLGPGESQTVRLQARIPRDMHDREFRSHIVFRNIPDERPAGHEDEEADGISIAIQARPGLSIPVIVRRGDLQADISIDGLAIEEEEDSDYLGLNLNRDGNKSTYGNLRVYHEDVNGHRTEIGRVNGVAVYTPLETRRYEVPLRNLENLNLSEGKVIARYEYDEDREAREKEVAEREVQLQ